MQTNIKTNIIQETIFPLPFELTLTKNLITLYTNKFWNEVFLPIYTIDNNIHLILMCKVKFKNPSESEQDGYEEVSYLLGYRSLAESRYVIHSDKQLFINYLVDRLHILSEPYIATPISEIIFTYIIREGLPNDSSRKLLNTEVKYDGSIFRFGSFELPQSMDPKDYGDIKATQNFPENNITRYVVQNNQNIFFIDASDTNNVNVVTFNGPKNIKWVDTLLHDNIIKREIGKKVYYIKDGVNILIEKEVNAKLFRTVKKESKLDNTNTFMTIDIETVLRNKDHLPYLICGYYNGTYIHSFAKDLKAIHTFEMLTNFISQIITFNDLKYVYAHNLSGFDGIFLLSALIKYPNSKVKPILFNNRLMGINFSFPTIIDNKKVVRKIIFKDSFLLLPLGLRKLCKAFEIKSPKGYFPFNFDNVNHSGAIPDIRYWPNITPSEYQKLFYQFQDINWNFKLEALKYCKLDCKSLHDILIKFNELL